MNNEAIEVIKQGSVKIDTYNIFCSFEEPFDSVIAMEIKLHNKDVDDFFINEDMEESDDAINITLVSYENDDADVYQPTVITCPRTIPSDGWAVFSIVCSKYTVRICLVRI